MSSPGPANATVFVRSPTISNSPFVSTLTVTCLISGLVTNTVTGMTMSSPGLATRGRVARVIRSRRTGTDFSAEPKAPPRPATTMTRTAPKYCGIMSSWTPLPPALRSNGPSNRTTGGNRRGCLALSAESALSSPPMARIRAISAP